MKTDVLVARIKKYIETHPEGYAAIAGACKVQDSNTPKAWVRNNRVPVWHKDRCIQFLNSEEAGGDSTNSK